MLLTFIATAEERALSDGQTVTVTDDNGHRTKGKVADLSTSSLALLVGRDPQKRVFTVDRTTKIVRHDSVENGIWIGLGIGVGVVVGLNKSCGGDSDCYAPIYFGLPSIAAGTLLGWAVDASIRKTLYLAPSASGTSRLRLAPLLSAEEKGLVISVGF